MYSRLCPYCMQMTDADTCPHCGKNTNYTSMSLHLPAGYVVRGRHPYVLGAALGQGGFGITYIALDMETQERVAIKEYFPTYCAGRTAENSVTAYPNQEDVFQKGRERFLDEARVLKSLSDLQSIVNVLDFFEFNNSAYMVMEFLEGDSLKSQALKNGKFPAQPFLKQLRPLMEDIDRMHQRGVVHRDIAPDNIILLPDGQMKLIDFGAARSYVGDKSMTVVVKKGFAPIEQYMRHGSSAATDVYALTATIYYCITGAVPPDSAERQYDEESLKSPISLGAEMSKEQERAILKALEVQPKKRTQSVAELVKALEHAPKPEKPKPVKKAEKNKAEPQKKPKWMIPVVAAVLLCILGGVLFLGKESPAAPVESEPVQIAGSENTAPEAESTDAVPESVVNVLSAPGKTNEEAFWGQSAYTREEVATVSFVYTLKDAPMDAVDVSAEKNGCILAWMTDGNLTVASNGHIALNPNSATMFYNFVNLKSVDFGDYIDTTRIRDMSRMFYNCKNLQELDLTNFNTSNATKMYGIFGFCEKLQTLDLSSFDTSKVTDMSLMFWRCKSLKTVNTSSFDTSNVTDMALMFGYCEKLQDLDVSNFNTAMVTNMSSIFCHCSSLSTLDVSGFNTSNVTKMEAMFKGCSKMEKLDLSGFDTSKVTTMGSMFMYCSTLSQLDISSFNTKKVENMEQMFLGCRSLQSLNLNHFKYGSVKKMTFMFGDCLNMEKLYMKGFVRNKQGVETARMFDNCPAKIIK